MATQETKQKILNSSFADAYQFIIDKYNTKESLGYFLDEFQDEIKGDFQILTLSLSDEDYLKIIDEYKMYGYGLPKVKLSKNGFYAFSHFIREIEDYSIVSNISGFKDSEKVYKECLFFDHELIQATDIGFNEPEISVIDQIPKFRHFFTVINAIRKTLNLEPLPYLKNPDGKAYIRQITSTTQTSKKRLIKKTGKAYAVTYYLDCLATNKKPLLGRKTELEQLISKEYTNEKPAPNTVRKAYDDIQRKNLTDKTVLIELLGDNWKSTVLELSTNKEALSNYIKKQIKTT